MLKRISKKMDILLIGDPHFKTNNVMETNKFVEETLKYVRENNDKIRFIVVMGDVLDTHEKINMQALCRANNFLLNLSSLCYTYVLIGNHDRMNNKVFLTEDHPFSGLKNVTNIKIIDKVFRYETFIFVPYVENGRFLEALDTVNFDPEEKCLAIFAHQEFKGTRLSSIISEHGDIWNEDYPVVFSGHIHQFQQPQKNIIYPGTPYQNSFYDNTEKFLLKISFKDNEYEMDKIHINTIKKKTIKAKVVDLDKIEGKDNTMIEVILEDDLNIIKKYLTKEMKEILDKKNISLKIKPINIKVEKKESRSSSFEENLKKNLDNLDEKIKKFFHSTIQSDKLFSSLNSLSDNSLH